MAPLLIALGQRIPYKIPIDKKPIIHDVTATWWWIAYHIVASAVITIRNRNDEEMKLQFRILTFGLIVKGSALCTFLAIPIFRRVFKKIPWHKKEWYSHCVTSTAMFVFWAMVLIVGFIKFKAEIYASSMNSNSGPHVMCKVSNISVRAPALKTYQMKCISPYRSASSGNLRRSVKSSYSSQDVRSSSTL